MFSFSVEFLFCFRNKESLKSICLIIDFFFFAIDLTYLFLIGFDTIEEIDIVKLEFELLKFSCILKNIKRPDFMLVSLLIKELPCNCSFLIQEQNNKSKNMSTFYP
ncbi:hypothetical protein BpHYR1_015921 [Brachionus plicatilis]|uniref:Uncharacterized protein n=1 Tax=Brachionus plicatilis TaxID=10195 RepID=A0A3M7TD45_BRAPC|nr:hypothetical protein BpHYR1_015921 [Brachionus plicatilis]